MPPRASLRVRALLAGGIVLGVGSTATLASWTDVENASGSFATSVFATESSVQGGTWAAHETAPGPTVTVNSAGYSPGTVGYLQVVVRGTAGSIAGGIDLTGATTTGAADLSSAFRYRVVRTTAACTAAAFTGTPTFVVGSTGAQPLGQGSTASSPLAAAPASAAGDATGFCFEVTLPAGAANTLQGKTATATWQLISTSV
ncbi:MAG: hypothetical protein H7146_10700 [Burkholderiaceae bacterium]|nr:hypothetical protein [Microbacteriaceae bacterium]